MIKRLLGRHKKLDSEELTQKLLRQSEEQMKKGESRQAIEQKLALVEIDHKDPDVLAKQSAYLRATQAMGFIFLERNEKGTKFENEGQIDKAIQLYEANVADEYMGQHPYERLRIIYRKRNDYTNAIRVCQAAVNCPFMDYKKKIHFQKWIDKMS